jgi:prolyl oligopeptidase
MFRTPAPRAAALLALALSIPLAAAPAKQAGTKAAKPALAPPVTETNVVSETLHGVKVDDPYRWLEDQTAKPTRDWIDSQNAFTDKVIGNLPDKAKFATRIEELQKVDVMSTPNIRGGRYFFTKRAAGQDLFSIFMRESANGPDILLIDPAPLSEKHTTSVGIDDISGDGKMLAYLVREGGADEVSTHFFDVDNRKEVGVPLERARYFGVALTEDSKGVYYTRTGKEGPRVYRRAVSGGEETKLFGDGYGPEKIISTGISDNGRWLVIQVLHGSAPKKTEIYVKDLHEDAAIKVVVNDIDFRTFAEVADDNLVLQTNWDAPNDRVMVVSAADPGRTNWKELIPENKKAALLGVSLAGGKVFARYLENVKPRVAAYTLDGKAAGEIHLDQLGTLTGVAGRWNSPVAFYSFSSFATPSTIYGYDVATGKSSVFFRQNAPVDSEKFTVEQVWYPSKDGTKVPMFVLYKKGLKKDGTNPTYLTGYGGFTQSSLPGFSTTAVAWAENGGVYALANLRGGGEFGEPWHRDGMLDRKQNTFDDFAEAARFLIDKKYTSSKHLGIAGGSNGGLLVTALLTQHPDLIKAVVCTYPLIDMLRYQKFLVGSFWVPEYGSADDAEQFKWIYAYSPYQHVVKGTKYPAVLFITGDADTRVAPLHARKMTALMQASTGSDNPVLLRYHISGGHSGGEPLKVVVNNAAETLSFLRWQLR